MLEQLKKEIKKSVIRNEFEKALQRLNEVVKEGCEYDNDITMLASRLYKVQSEERKGIISGDEVNIKNNKIGNAILEIKDKLTQDDLKDDIILRESRPERLCVITTPNSDNEKSFKELLPSSYFNNVTYCKYSDVLAQDDKLIDLYVFDYQKNQEDLLKELLLDRDKKPVLIFVRGTLKWLFEDTYIDRWATANSIFSFHSRLDEILETQKWRGRANV